MLHSRRVGCIAHDRLHRRGGERDGDVRVVRFRSKATGRQMTIRVETEDDLIDEGDHLAAVQSDEVHNDSKPDLGGWCGLHSTCRLPSAATAHHFPLRQLWNCVAIKFI
jgi:hypothetical protein